MTKRILVALAASLVCGASCDDAPESHQYVAARYEAPNGSNGAHGCLESSAAIDVVAGDNGSMLCAPACLVGTVPGGGTRVYVSSMCAPYPAGIDTSGTDPSCPDALAAWQAYVADPVGCACGGECAGDDGGAGDDAPGDDAPGDDAPGDDAPGDDAPGDDASDGGAE